MEEFPVGQQFSLMQFSPGFHQSSLPLWKFARDQFDRIDTENSHVVLIPRVKMRDVMWRPGFGEHADHNSKKPAEFRHKAILSRASCLTPSLLNRNVHAGLSDSVKSGGNVSHPGNQQLIAACGANWHYQIDLIQPRAGYPRIQYLGSHAAD